jgi:hypothetical protein
MIARIKNTEIKLIQENKIYKVTIEHKKQLCAESRYDSLTDALKAFNDAQSAIKTDNNATLNKFF